MVRRVVIMGAAGRDFHNFNVFFRNNENYRVVAFTAAQLPNIAGRIYPPELAGPLYPDGIPIYPEEDLPKIIRENDVDLVVFSYSDVSHQYIMERAAIAQANGADFMLLGPKSTMLKSNKPVIAVTAARTGAGKSPTSRRVSKILKARGLRVSVVRHPMPYGDLRKQIVQRFASLEDLDRHNATIEEREDYEPHLRIGNIVYAGVDYEKILREAEKESDVILWDGGNNDFPFYKPDLMITVVDPLRAGHELTHWPGSVNVRMADVIIVSKVDTACYSDIEKVIMNVERVNPRAKIITAAIPYTVDKPELIEGKRVIVVEDGPTVTHGDMGFGAGYLMARKLRAEIIDPRPYAVGSIKETYEKYTHLSQVLPAVGYGEAQMKELEETINKSPAEAVVLGTPTDISRYLKINKPAVHVYYELQEIGSPTLEDVIDEFLKRVGL
ncbi:MAG: cyclic 2,3-diphosphoglycerate synthase [Candidatus Korarchaeum sp.]|jgi:predicted GTPase|nr:cyclic 2,3-diphosphoglycerate synthase [Candidatus Korarchaeum sp.]